MARPDLTGMRKGDTTLERSARRRPLLTRIVRVTIALSLALAGLSFPLHPLAEERQPHRGVDATTDCDACHTTEGWSRLRGDVTVRINHASTGFPLRAAHSALECIRCHDGRGLATEGAGCIACHADVHRGEHGQSCERCHDERTFTVSDGVRRHRETRLPLIGAHAVAACEACHLERGTGRFTGLPTECASCHLETYANTTEPPHSAGGLSTQCEECHTERGWLARSGFHEQRFPIRGAHAALECSSCHVGNVYRGTPSDCFACHATAYNGTSSPPHAASGLSTDCESCHVDAAWTPASRFRHDSFGLDGAHSGAPCLSCHQNNVFVGTPRDCFACHADAYNTTSNPPHVAAAFPTDCETCHTTSVWIPASRFRHNTYPLDGAHSAASCLACHPGSVYAGTARDCYACHAATYNATSRPPHATSGFGTTCEGCHTTSAWTPSTFDHQRYFPIASGDHARYRNDCQACHPTPQDPRVFTCTACHEHRQSETDNEHRGRAGYVYESGACYQCHPDGRE